MKTASAPLLALLNSGVDFQTADLWTITLNGGTVIRWSGADVKLVSGGQTFALGPGISRNAITEKIGLEVATLEVTITADSADLINGTPIIPFIAKRGLDGANVRLDRAFLTDWNLPVVGTVLRFSGKLTSVPVVGGSEAQLTISSWTAYLNANMPANLYQAACLHSPYDAGCTLLPATYAQTGTISGTPTLTGFSSGMTTTAGDFAQGRVTFTSGPLTGIAATVRSNDGAGGFQFVRALPALPIAGNTFSVIPGCDLTISRCGTRFNNLLNRKGTDFVPVPETAFG
ncbi:DUF2163 domain-containing protein [Sphingomonas sp. HMP6]|uniref:DUF2163 domain-containing protein n=1 Tax=Sphingomonas sp. HMP6 TaxID=1517551 RepID=UPI001596D838|nr:DUF2163 domain-containing protein [Sphingomonas sp. HMP6]BCA57677.1 hypothetical protein HMP06_0446 [Sphingomonas sp. HMP6]